MPQRELTSFRPGALNAFIALRAIAVQSLLAGFIVIATLCGTTKMASAQTPPPAGAYIVAYIEVASASQDKAAALLKSWADTVKKNPDNLGIATLRRRGPTNHFAIVEAWKDAKAFESEAASPEAKTFRAALEPMLIAPYDERPHAALAVNWERTKAAIKAAGPDAVFAVTHVDVIPPKKDEGIAATKGLFEPGSKSAGNLSFDVLQQASRQNHMTLFEAWKNMDAMAANAGEDFMKSYRFALQPMSGALFDHRIYAIIR